MGSFFDRLREIKDLCKEGYEFTQDDRDTLHNAYWKGDQLDSGVAVEILSWHPEPEDMPVLLDASSPSSPMVHRCDAAQALGCLELEGASVLRLMLLREKHPLVRFYAVRELIDLEDDVCLPLLDGPIPPNASPNRRSLWIYGNYQRGTISGDMAIKFGEVLSQHKWRYHAWLIDHIQQSEAESES